LKNQKYEKNVVARSAP